jgi:hypothetical protein
LTHRPRLIVMPTEFGMTMKAAKVGHSCPRLV